MEIKLSKSDLSFIGTDKICLGIGGAVRFRFYLSHSTGIFWDTDRWVNVSVLGEIQSSTWFLGSGFVLLLFGGSRV